MASTLRADTSIWPEQPGLEDVVEDAATLLDLEEDASAALALPPTTPEILDLIDRADSIAFRLAALDACQLAALGLADTGAWWLAGIVGGLIEMALERVDKLAHFDVIRFVRLAALVGILGVGGESVEL